MTSEGPCIFCEIAAGRIPATTVHESVDVVGFRDLSPQAPEHVLFIPRTHVSSADDLSQDEAGLAGALVLAATAYARSAGLSERGYRLVVNVGADGGQSVGHLHLHLLGGRAMLWPPG